MKFTAALLSLATLALSAPLGDPTKVVAGVVADVDANVANVVKVAGGAVAGAKILRREPLDINAIAAAAAHIGRREPLDINAIAAAAARIGRREPLDINAIAAAAARIGRREPLDINAIAAAAARIGRREPINLNAAAAAGLHVGRRDIDAAAAALADVKVGEHKLGTIPKHAPHTRRHGEVPNLNVIEADVLAAAHAHIRRDVKNFGAALDPVEVAVKALVAQIGSKTITLAEAKVLVPKVTALLVSLKAQLDLLAPLSKEVSAVLGTDDRHTIAVRIAGLVDEILAALACLETVLGDKFEGLRPVIVTLNVSIQAVLDISVKLVDGLDKELSPLLKPLAKTLAQLKLSLHVGVFGL